MALGILAKKLGMTQIFDTDGSVIPVTVLLAGPCPILYKKTREKDGYCALQIGFDPKPERLTNKPDKGRFDAAKTTPLRLVREVRLDDDSQGGNYETGQVLDVGVFAEGEKVDVVGVSKGRGFAGTVKRHHTSRGPETHGSMYHRRPGAMGQSADPSHVYKGKKLPGHMGHARVTTLNLKVVRTDKEKNLLLLKGSVPGHPNSYVLIRKSTRNRKKA
ncbi:MAG: 50S ribosomal protein L3 [bacterium]